MRSGVLLDRKTGRPEVEYDPLADVRELERLHTPDWKPRLGRMLRDGELLAAGGAYYQDSRPPFNTAAYPSITLATTSKMLVPASPNTLVQPSEWYAGKKFMVRAFGQFTSAATPGNLTLEVRLATADNGGTLLGTTAALTWIASQTNKWWRAEFRVECWSTGNGGVSGSLLATGVFECNPASIAVAQAGLPDSAPAAVTVDLSAAVGVSLQAKRSGSTVETIQVFSQEFAALN